MLLHAHVSIEFFMKNLRLKRERVLWIKGNFARTSIPSGKCPRKLVYRKLLAKCCPRYLYPLTISQRRHKERLYDPAEMAYCQMGGYACASDPQVIPYIQSVLGNFYKIMFELLEIICEILWLKILWLFISRCRFVWYCSFFLILLFNFLIKNKVFYYYHRLCETSCIYVYAIYVIFMRYTKNIYGTYSHCALGIGPRGARGDRGVRKSRLRG